MNAGLALGEQRPNPVWVLVALLVALGWAFSSSAAAEEQCDSLFPDFTCKDRQARPDGAVMPMSFPYLFEDPHIATGLNLVGIYHDTPSESVVAGGDIYVVALQARLAITDRLALIATKDGYAWIDSDLPIVSDSDGFFNISAGLKYAAWKWEDEEDGASAIITPSLRYEIPVGEKDVYQGSDDGIFIPTLSGGYHEDGWNLIGDIGGQVPVDRDHNSSSVFYNLHASHAFPLQESGMRFIVPFIELNGIHYARSGDGSRSVRTRLGKLSLKTATNALMLNPFEGVDVANLGASGISGGDLVTMAWGIRLPFDNGVSLGASYERPLSNREDIFEQRVTVMLTWEL